MTEAIIIIAIALTVVLFRRGKRVRNHPPVCNCFGNNKHTKQIHSELQGCYTDSSISFYICQCKICGGLTGQPVGPFNKFMENADSEEISEILNKFYNNMQNPL